MRNIVAFIVSVLVYNLTVAQTLEGRWNGILQLQQTQLAIVFNISSQNGIYSATMDSPDQGAIGIPMDEVKLNGVALDITASSMKLFYKGTLNNRKDSITGTFTQGGQNMPLVLSKTIAVIPKLNRPQTPQPPFSYLIKKVEFSNAKANVKLSGTLTLPDTISPHPIVILISGSGPQNRDEELLGHKPFLVLADHLTQKGFAVLRYDDRGVGESTGNFNTATSADFASDVLAAIEFVKTLKGINTKKIGLIGHSEGGMIAPMVAVQSKDVAFIVLLAAPGVPIKELMLSQIEKSARAEGVDERLIKINLSVMKKMSDLIISNPKMSNKKLNNLLERELTQIFDTLPDSIKPPTKEGIKQQIRAQSLQFSGNWYRYFIAYDPKPTLQKVKCPVLAINGSLDVQVEAEQNLEGIKKSLNSGNNKQFTIYELKGLNHLFQEGVTGAVSEYSKLEQTMSVQMLNVVTTWLLETIIN